MRPALVAAGRERPVNLSEWLRVMDAAGELQVVSGAHWDLEIGAISELNYRRTPPAALLFDTIPGYPPGYRVLTGALSSARRIGLTLGLGDEMTDATLVQALRGKPSQWERSASDFSPIERETAPIFENVVRDADINLLQFPVPRWHEHDGGRYIGTGCLVITSDPTSGLSNLGAYRMMVQEDGRSVTVDAQAGKHGRRHYEAWFEKVGRAPIVATFGQDPLLLMVGGTEVPASISEYAYAGAMVGSPIEVVRGEVTGLPIPASAEIAVEGWIYPDRLMQEGPFGEWTGYYSGSTRPVPLIQIERLYYRDSPILLGAPPSKPPHDYSYMRASLKSAMIQDALIQAGVPEVRGVWCHESGGGRLLVVVSIKQRYCGHSRQAGYLAAQTAASAYMNRFVIVVDEDIDPLNLQDVMWAVCTRCEPAEDIEIMRKTWGSRNDPLLPIGAPPYNSRAILDACRPFERRDTFPRTAQASPALLRRTAATWKELFSDPRFPLPASAVPSSTVEEDSSSATGSMT